MGCIALSIVSLTVSSCGNIFTAQVPEDALSLGVNSLMATPRQWVYPLDSKFTPAKELTVMAFYADGTTQNVPVETVEIAFKEVPADIYDAILLSEGPNPFKVYYHGKNTEFILMTASSVQGNPDDTGSGGGTGGETTIEIPPPIWQ
jgi:hypothetical protein